MKRILYLLLLSLAVLSYGLPASGESPGRDTGGMPVPPLPEGDYSWMENIRKEHPRMFLTVDDIPQIRKTAETFENGTYLSMKKRIDDLIGSPVTFPDSLAATGESNRNHEWGYRASEAAMLYLITGDPVYLVISTYPGMYFLRYAPCVHMTGYIMIFLRMRGMDSGSLSIGQCTG